MSYDRILKYLRSPKRGLKYAYNTSSIYFVNMCLSLYEHIPKEKLDEDIL